MKKQLVKLNLNIMQVDKKVLRITFLNRNYKLQTSHSNYFPSHCYGLGGVKTGQNKQIAYVDFRVKLQLLLINITVSFTAQFNLREIFD